MDFFITNNLNTYGFISYMSQWREGKDWQEEGQGYPSLRFDFHTQCLFLQFIRLDSLDNIIEHKLADFKFSIIQRRHIFLFEMNDSIFDLALSFKNSESCIKFKTLLIHYIQTRTFIREKTK